MLKLACKRRYEHVVHGRLLRRYKRFLADVVLGEGGNNGNDTAEHTIVHCPNTGAMTGMLDR
eukprot:359869-Chlamydomonas_euryale.AAC.10